jgi:2-polyprenyl-3-methyl-5-hydroxy-6-metoxy-1,4-benzoquinol methylase
VWYFSANRSRNDPSALLRHLVAERICPLCKSDRVAGAFKKERTDFWHCRACSFWFATPSANPNLANEIGDYEQAYLQYLQPDRADQKNFDELRAWFEQFGSIAAARLLDVGAGSGKLVRHLRAAGVAATGLEPSRALYDNFLAGDPAFTCGVLDDYRSLDGRPMDVITAFDVIEHVAHPLPFLDNVAAQLRPGGLFFMSTPDVGSWTARMFGRRWHFFNPYHLSYFSKETLVKAAEARGF